MELSKLIERSGYLAVAFGLLLILAACNSERPLAGDYKLIFMSGREVRIARTDRYPDHSPNPSVMLAGNVKLYAVQSPYITGYADTQYLDLSAEPDARTGYFLIDTTSDKIVAYGMDETQWRKELQRVGLTAPELKRPHVWF